MMMTELCGGWEEEDPIVASRGVAIDIDMRRRRRVVVVGDGVRDSDCRRPGDSYVDSSRVGAPLQNTEAA